MTFEDRRSDMFGRLPDVHYLLDRARLNGFTAVVSRPQMGKSWLLTEVARVLSTERGHLIGYAGSVGQTTGLMAQALSDLYVYWLLDPPRRERAHKLWESHRRRVSQTTARMVEGIFQGLKRMESMGQAATPATVHGLVRGAFELSGNPGVRLRLPRLNDVVARELTRLAADLSGMPVTLVLDAWEQSPSLAWEHPPFLDFPGRLEGWRDCHVFICLRPEGAAWVEHLQAASPAVHLFRLPPMHLGHEDEQGRLVRFLRERVPAAKMVVSRELLAMVQDFPGVMERWAREHGRGRLDGPADLRREADDARHYRHAEFDDLLPSLSEDERKLAMRLALFPLMNQETAAVYRDILFENLDGRLVGDLQAKWVLVGQGVPDYGSDSRHVAARHWFLKHSRPQTVAEAEALTLHLGRQLQGAGARAWPFLFALASVARTARDFNLSGGVRAIGAAAVTLCPGGGSDPSHLRLLRAAGRAAIQKDRRVGPLVGQALFHGLIRATHRDDSLEREAILNDLRGLHRSWPEDVHLREWLALGLMSVPRERAGGGDAGDCASVLDELRGLHRGWPDHAVAGEWLALGVLNALVDSAEENDRAGRDRFLRELRRLHRERPGNAIMRESFILGLVNVLVDASEEGNLEAHQQCWDELSGLQQAWPDDRAGRTALSLDVSACQESFPK